MSLDIMEELARAGAIYKDQHFVYASLKHGSAYINADALFPNLELLGELGTALWAPTEKLQQAFDVVAAPATGGIPLAYAAGNTYRQETKIDVDVVWADKTKAEDGEDEEFAFERATFVDRVRGKQVLVVEDLLTTGGSVAKVCRLVEAAGGTVIGVSAVCNRGGVTAEQLGVPWLRSVAEVDFEAIEADSCPLCAANIPIVEDIGRGAKFREAHPDYAGGYVTLLT